MGGSCFSPVNVDYFCMRAVFWNKVKQRLQPNGETVYTRRGIHQKYVVPEKSKFADDEEEPSGIVCDLMDILYVLEMNLAFYAWYK